MNTLDFTAGAQTSGPLRTRARPAESGHPLLWVSGVLAGATIAFSVVLVAAKFLSHDAVALEPAPIQPDPFYQQKVDAKVEELPAQF